VRRTVGLPDGSGDPGDSGDSGDSGGPGDPEEPGGEEPDDTARDSDEPDGPGPEGGSEGELMVAFQCRSSNRAPAVAQAPDLCVGCTTLW
jgi:hypothetical protein